MVKHTISVEDICGSKQLFQHEWILAASYPKMLVARYNLNRSSGVTDITYILHDNSNEQSEVLITNNLKLAIDRYNEM